MIKQINPNPGDNTELIDSHVEMFGGRTRARKIKAKNEADIALLNAQTAAKNDTLKLEASLAAQGYKAPINDAQAKIDLTNAESSGDKTLYIILAVVVVVVMIGLYFIMKRK